MLTMDMQIQEISDCYSNKPEVDWGIRTKEDLGHACIHFIVYPLQYSFDGPPICILYLHFYFYLGPFLKVTASDQRKIIGD